VHSILFDSVLRAGSSMTVAHVAEQEITSGRFYIYTRDRGTRALVLPAWGESVAALSGVTVDGLRVGKVTVLLVAQGGIPASMFSPNGIDVPILPRIQVGMMASMTISGRSLDEDLPIQIVFSDEYLSPPLAATRPALVNSWRTLARPPIGRWNGFLTVRGEGFRLGEQRILSARSVALDGTIGIPYAIVVSEAVAGAFSISDVRVGDESRGGGPFPAGEPCAAFTSAGSSDGPHLLDLGHMRTHEDVEVVARRTRGAAALMDFAATLLVEVL
jgi:hypothetical protein